MKPSQFRSFIKEIIAESLPKKAFLVISLQYDDAKPVNDLINAGKYNDAIKYMAQWDYGGENEHTVYDMPYGTDSKTIQKGPYVLVWNPRLDDTVTLYRTARGKGGQGRETITKSELKEVIKATLRTILNEMKQDPRWTIKLREMVPGDDTDENEVNEMTVTGDVAPINLPGSAMPGTGKSGWVSGAGGSKRGVAGSEALGYTLTPIGKQDMKRKQDPVY